jgi:hypothetical protein
MLEGLLHNNYYIIELINNRSISYFKILNYKKLNFNLDLNEVNITYLLKKNTINSIILNDVKLLLCKGKFKIMKKKFSDNYKIINSDSKLKTNNIVKSELKELVLLSNLEDNLYFLENSNDIEIFVKVINLLNIGNSLKIDILSHYNNFIRIFLKYNFSKREIIYMLNNSTIDDFTIFKKILSDLTNLNFQNSLLDELLLFITISDLKYSTDLLNMLLLDEIIKSKFKKIDENKKDNTTELYNSIISRTDWKEEYNYGNIMGLLINVKPTELNKCYFSYENIDVCDITTSIVGLDQILESYKLTNEFNVSISGNGIGNGNCMIPLYISDDHWKLVKIYENYNYGLIFNRNPLLYCNDMNKIYKVVLLKMINLTFSDKNYRSDKWINLLFSVLFTTTKLFLKGKYIKNLTDRYKLNINDLLYNFLIYGDIVDYKYIVEELIRRCFKKIYKNIDILDSIYNIGHIDDVMENKISLSENNFKKWLNEIETNKIFIDTIKLIYGIYKMKFLCNKKYIKSVLSNEELEELKYYIKKNEIRAKSYELRGLLNENFNHVNFCKNKIYSIDLLCHLGIIKNKFDLRSMLIQCMMQRVDKLAKKNINYIDPFSENSKFIIINNFSIFKQRYIKKLYELSNVESYIKIINSIELFRLKFFLDLMVNNTISLKNKIKNNINFINLDRRKYIL